MKLPFRQKKQNQTNQKEGKLIELSLEEQQVINGGGWASRAACDAYYRAIFSGNLALANQYVAQYHTGSLFPWL